MAAHNIDMFEEGNKSSHTETTNSNNNSPFTRNSQKKIHPYEWRCLLLKFSDEIIAPVLFTGDCIFPKGTKLELVDDVTGQQVRYGYLASAQVEVFLLNGDESWSIEELNSPIMMQKRGGKSGRCKNPYLRLEGGVVSVNDVKFKHTPKHMKKLKVVRLGARLVDLPEEIEVIEAVTGPFTVKDKRLKSKKHYPPSPTDDVWRLEQIYLNGAFHNRLTENGIKTVEDFLIEYHNNPLRLRNILGKSMSRNSWNTVTSHAKSCNLDGRKYLYYHLETEQTFAVVFNVAGQVISLDSGCGLHLFNILSESQKAYAHKLVETAFANWENVLKFDDDILLMDHLSVPSKFSTSSCPTIDDFQYSDQLQLTSMLNFIQRTAERDQWMVSAECFTSYAIVGQHVESNEMFLDIPAPGQTTAPNQITSLDSNSGDYLEKFIHLNSGAIQFEDFPCGEPGQANYSAAETSATQFHGLQHDETMHLSQNQFTHLMDSGNVQSIIIGDSTNANQQHQMNNVLMVPVASTCKGKCKKSWTKISSILKWLLLKRYVNLKKVHSNKKRKFSK